MEDAGLDPDKPPQTKDEYMEALEQLKGKGIQGSWVPPSYYTGRHMFTSLLWQFGGDLYNEDATRATVNSDAGVDALTWMVDLVKKGYSPKNVAQDGDVIALQNGQTAFDWNGIWMINVFGAVPDLEWGVAPLPEIGTEKAAWANSHNFVIPNQPDPNPDMLRAVKVFIAYVIKNSQAWAEGGQVPALNAVRESKQFKKLEWQPEFAKELPYVHYGSSKPGVTEINDNILYTAVNDAVLLNTTPKDALDTPVSQANKLLKQNKQKYGVEIMAAQNVEQTGAQPTPPGAGYPTGGKADTTRAFSWTPYVFLASYLVLFTVFVLIPAVFGLWISLHNWDYLLPEQPWVGLENYTNLFTPGSPTAAFFWQSMEATGIFTLFSVPLLVIIPLLVTLVLNQEFAGRNFFRAMYFAPYVLGVAVIGVLWQYMLNPGFGIINYYLGLIGIGDGAIPWTTALPWAWISLVGLTVWWTLGFNAIIYLAGLQDINPELYEAAKVDGANRWQRFWNVTLPGLRPVLLFIITVTILASANMFGQSYLVTDGNPANATRTAIMYIAEEGLENFRMGSAAAMSYILALFLVLISILNFRFLNQKEEN